MNEAGTESKPIHNERLRMEESVQMMSEKRSRGVRAISMAHSTEAQSHEEQADDEEKQQKVYPYGEHGGEHVYELQ